MLIGITGTDGAGKGSVVELLVQDFGFVHYSSRAIILEYIHAANLPDTRAQMRLTANELRAAHGNDFLVTMALAKMRDAGVTKAVVESIRATAEAVTLKAAGGVLLAVDADQTVRYERVQRRRSESDQVTLAQFIAHEELEKNDPDPHGMQKGKVIAMADYTILNEGTLDALKEAVAAFMATLG